MDWSSTVLVAVSGMEFAILVMPSYQSVRSRSRADPRADEYRHIKVVVTDRFPSLPETLTKMVMHRQNTPGGINESSNTHGG